MSLQKIGFYFFSILFFCTLLAIFMPATSMPEAGLDPSWHLAMNHAIAENLAIGKDIIFTFGPYSSLYTHEFNAATYQINLIGNLYLTLCYFAATMFLMRNVNLIWPFLFWAVIAITQPADPLFFSYIFLAFLSALNLTDSTKFSNFLLLVIFSPLGFIPLIKGSFLFLCIAAIGGSVLIFVQRRKLVLAAITIFSPIFSMLFFWKIAGQEFATLPDYFLNMLQIISGYNEAMSESFGKSKNIVAFLVSSLVILFSVNQQKKGPLSLRDTATRNSPRPALRGSPSRMSIQHTGEKFSPLENFILTAMTGAYLFLTFKAGFIRHDIGHAAVQSVTPLIISLLLPCILTYEKPLIFKLKKFSVAIVPVIALLGWIITGHNYKDLNSQKIFSSLTNQISTISNFKSAIFERESLEKKFAATISQINSDNYLPRLAGTSDIYPFDQSTLIASSNDWSPRPIFQSYSAYTPKLLELNAQHLLSTKAPDNIFFKVYAISDRINSLDDGISWPIILQNYQPVALQEEFLILKKQKTDQPSIEKISSEEHSLGEEIKVPSGGIIFSEIEIKLSFLGKIWATLFKPNQLELNVTLADGSTRSYRIHSVTAKTGFVISPLIENTAEFSMLYNAANILSDKEVKSFNVSARKKRKFGWNTKYHITFSKLETRKDSQYRFKTDSATSELDKKTIVNSASCVGKIEEANGETDRYTKDKLKDATENNFAIAQSTLITRGWLKNQTDLQKIFVTLKDKDGNYKFLTTKTTKRKVYNSEQKTDETVYEFFSYASNLQFNGDYSLSFSYLNKGVVENCAKFEIPLKFNPKNSHDLH